MIHRGRMRIWQKSRIDHPPNNRVKLLHVIGTFLHGGTERLMLDILSRLPQDAFDTTACCLANLYLPDVTRAFQEAGIRITVFPQQPGPGLVVALTRFIREGRFDIVHTHHYYGNLHCRLAAILAGTPVIMTCQHNWPGEEKSRHQLAFRLLNRWTYRNITVSEAIRQYDIEQVGIAPVKVVTIYNGIDTTVFRPALVEQRLEAKRALGLPPTGKVVGMVGRLVGWKRFDLFIQAAAVILHNGRDVHFLIVGDGEMREPLAQLTQHLNVGDHVHFLGWRTDMPEVYRAMDVFCLSSDSGGKSFDPGGGEGFGLVSAEAMAAGVPVVAVDTEVNREVISERCGLLCRPEPDVLAEEMCRLIANPLLRHRLGGNGRARVEERFDINRAAAQLSDIYLEAVQEKRLGRSRRKSHGDKQAHRPARL